MQSGAKAYYNTATTTMSPRELESSLLLRAASQIQMVQDNWDTKKGDLFTALEYNKRLWTILLSAVTKPENPLPASVRENVANIGIFILGRIVEISLSPSPEKLTALIALNRELAVGLRTKAV